MLPFNSPKQVTSTLSTLNVIGFGWLIVIVLSNKHPELSVTVNWYVAAPKVLNIGDT